MVGHIGVLEDIPGYHYDFSTAPKRLRPLGALVDASHCCPDMPIFLLASINNIYLFRDFLSFRTYEPGLESLQYRSI